MQFVSRFIHHSLELWTYTCFLTISFTESGSTGEGLKKGCE